jgi:hypothetical protein
LKANKQKLSCKLKEQMANNVKHKTMDVDTQGLRQEVENNIENNAASMHENGINPFQIQNYRMEQRQELARNFPDTEKYGQALLTALQYRHGQDQ